MNKKQSLQQFLKENVKNRNIGILINATAHAAIKIANHLQNTFLDENLLGVVSEQNIHGEDKKKLDIIANNIFIDSIKQSKACDIIVSEEMEQALILNTDANLDNYLVAFDPLDGSSNIDVNGPLGSIFSIYKYDTSASAIPKGLINGKSQVAAGYVLYGSSIILAIAVDNGLYFFVLDKESNKFYLTHNNVKIPKESKNFCVNMGNYNRFTDSVKKNIDFYINNNYSFRYSAAMVADIHRIIISGGIFLYPGDTARPAIGKLRLLYECNPMAFILNKAGGSAIDAYKNIVEIDVVDIHQKCAIIAGAKNEVVKFLNF